MRALLECELPLVTFLFELADLPLPKTLVVQRMADGEMGSLAFGPIGTGRRYGSSPAECHFRDSDGVIVSASLNLDEQDAPYEVDVWKVDFSPLLRWPTRADLVAGPA
jgi:Domain of unknown function (DUF6984)